MNAEGIFTDPKDWWAFINWRDELEKTASTHGVLLFGYQQARELARICGAESEAAEYKKRIEQITAAGRGRFFDPKAGVYTSGPARAGVVGDAGVDGTFRHRGAAAGRGCATQDDADEGRSQARDAVPVSLLLDVMLTCGMKAEARELMRDYWFGMVNAGADTFWEIYDDAWSCTPSYFIRARGLG